jgi:DNA-binding CsgD family transcriptional regulator
LLVGHVSGGLLYGSEVARPVGMEGGRVRAFRPVVNRVAPKRERVLEGLLAGKTLARIAEEMGIRVTAVQNHVSRICRQERAKDRHELARKLGSTAAQPVNEVERAVARAAERRRRVVERLREGLRDEEIRSRLSIGRGALRHDLEWLCRRHGVEGTGVAAGAGGEAGVAVSGDARGGDAAAGGGTAGGGADVGRGGERAGGERVGGAEVWEVCRRGASIVWRRTQTWQNPHPDPLP